jgi:hypothetical protein
MASHVEPSKIVRIPPNVLARADRGIRSGRALWQEVLEGYLTGAIVKANLKLVEHSRATEKIKPDAEALREAHGSCDL